MSAAAPRVIPTGEPSAKEIQSVFVGLMIVNGLGALDQSIVATALPRIVSDLGGLGHLAWVVTAYVLASTSVMPLYGKLSDHYGRKPMIYVAVLTFLVGSVLCGLSQNLTQLIIFRAIQGLGAGGLLPLSQITIGDLVPPARRGSKQGSIAAVFAACSVIGPVLGGAITSLLSWHWIFYINLPIGGVALFMIARALRRPHARRDSPIDYFGAALLTSATTAFLLVLSLGGSSWAWASTPLLACAAAALALAALFIVHARRSAEPVLPLDLFQDRLFSIACVVLALTFMGLLGASVFFPLFFQLVMGVSPGHSGMLTAPLMVGVVISSVVNGRMLLRSGRYKPAQVFGLALATAAFAVLAWSIATARGLLAIESAIFCLGLGLGLVMPNMTIAVQNRLPASRRGVGTATLAFARSLGGLVGVTGSGAIVNWQLRTAAAAGSGTGDALHAVAEGGLRDFASLPPEVIEIYRHALATTFFLGACIVAAALITIRFLPEHPLRSHGAGE
jgi:EmrB/QacA subfamily drug resistance transporter